MPNVSLVSRHKLEPLSRCRIDALSKKIEKPQPRNYLKPPDELEKRSDNLSQSVYIGVLNSTCQALRRSTRIT